MYVEQLVERGVDTGLAGDVEERAGQYGLWTTSRDHQTDSQRPMS